MPRMSNAEMVETPEFKEAAKLGANLARNHPVTARRVAAQLMAREIKSDSRVFDFGICAGIIDTIGMGDYYADVDAAAA